MLLVELTGSLSAQGKRVHRLLGFTVPIRVTAGV
jgi:hypothetical protein